MLWYKQAPPFAVHLLKLLTLHKENELALFPSVPPSLSLSHTHTRARMYAHTHTHSQASVVLLSTKNA